MSLDNYDKSDQKTVDEIKKINDKVKEDWLKRIHKEKIEAEEIEAEMVENTLMDMKNE